MEVSGRKPDPDEELASTEDFTQGCQHCEQDGNYVPAKKYCQQCEEYLCVKCCDSHRKVKILRNHLLLDISQEKRVTRTALTPTITCSVHKNSIIDQFCPSHNATVCSACAPLKHTHCQVQYIPDISAKYDYCEEYKKLQRGLETVLQRASSLRDSAVKNKEKTRGDSKVTTEKIKNFGEKLDGYLNQKEEEMLLKVKQMKREDVSKIKEALTECDRVKADAANMQNELSLFGKNASDLLIKSKEILSHLKDLQDNIKTIETKSQPSYYHFIESKELEDLLSSKSFGSVVKVSQVQNENDVFTYSMCSVSKLKDINVEATEDKRDCAITRILFLAPDVLVLVDYNNFCIKRIDISSNTITSYLPLPSWPWDITQLDAMQAATTLPMQKKIVIISTNEVLSLVETISVNGECRGIDSTADKIIVSFINPAKVEVLDHSGKVLNKIVCDKEGSPLFSCPCYLRVVMEMGLVVYVSDRYTSTITKLSMTGQVLFTYKNKDLSRPYGLDITDDGHVLVCGNESQNVQVVSQDGKLVSELLSTEEHGIAFPLTVCYIQKGRSVYVNCSDNQPNQLRVYKLQTTDK